VPPVSKMSFLSLRVPIPPGFGALFQILWWSRAVASWLNSLYVCIYMCIFSCKSFGSAADGATYTSSFICPSGGH